MSSVLFVAEGGDSSCAYYRAHVPAVGLRQLGWDVTVSPAVYTDDHGMLVPDESSTPDVVVCRRMTDAHGQPHSSEGMFLLARDNGQAVYVDLDDDPWYLPEWNPAYGTMMGARLSEWVRDMEAATGVIVSTPALAESVREHTAQTNVIVCRNGVEPEHFDTVRAWPHEPFRLAWCGLVSFRGNDLTIAKDALWRWFSDPAVRDGVELWHLGDHDTEGSMLDVLGDDFPGHVVSVPWVPVQLWPKALAEVDAVMIPQISGPFADARSDATGLACAAAGVPFAASPSQEYDRLWTQHGIGYSVPDDEWLHALYVLTDPAVQGMRADMRRDGIVYARERRGPVTTARQYHETFAREMSHA